MLSEPPDCRERASTPPGSSTPASRARSASRTPVQRWVVDQPSTHAMGRAAVTCSMASSSSRLNVARRPSAPRRSSRQPGPTSARGDIRHCFADVALARDVLGFEARTGLDEGLPQLADWVARQRVEERGDEAVAGLRARGLVG